MMQIIIDAHLDLAYNAVVLKRDLLRSLAEPRRDNAEETLPPGMSSETHLTSVPALFEGHVVVVGASIFVAPAFRSWQQEPQVYHTPDEANRQAIAQLDYYRRLADEDERVSILNVTADLESVLSSQETDTPHLGLFVVMEGAEPIRDPGDLGWWVERGVRGIALSWSAGSRYAGGNAVPGSLTDEGRALLTAMSDDNLLLDISHLWEEAVYEALGRYPGPVAATHANPRAFADTPRQLSDDLIRRIADRDGVVGVVPYNRMLDALWRLGDVRLPLARLAEAIDHICQVTGSASFVGIGSDFDGGFGRESVPEGLDSVADLARIEKLLAERGYSASDITAILSENWLRVMRQVLDAM